MTSLEKFGFWVAMAIFAAIFISACCYFDKKLQEDDKPANQIIKE